MSQNSKFVQTIIKACEIDSKYAVQTIDDIVEYIFENNFPNLLESSKKTESDIKINIPTDNGEQTKEDFWIFGYGSLIWKADFPYISRKRGYIRGFERKFYQNSIDHRGTHQKPGRVVTLVASSDNHKVYGMAYKIAEKDKDNVLNHLDYREKNGYDRCCLEFYPYPEGCDNNKPEKQINAITYIATQNNESYAGHVFEEIEIAEQIFNAAGPSGTNREYVYKLSKAMKFLFSEVEDSHLFKIEKLLRSKEERNFEIAQNVKREIRNNLDKLGKRYIEDNSFDLNNLNIAINLIQQQFCEKSYLLDK